jgi:hypothetical protein
MALKFYDRVRVAVASAPGTGAATLGAATNAFQSFTAAGASNGDTFPYLILDGNNWEIGVGTYSSTGPTVTRTTLTASSTGSPINFTANAIVMCAIRAEDMSSGGGALSTLTDVLLSSPTNGQVLTYNSGASKWENAGIVGLFSQVMSATPTASSTGLSTWVNQGSATTANAATGLQLIVAYTGSSNNVRALAGATLPSTPYTITALIMATRLIPTNYDFCGIGFINPSTGAAQLFGLYSVNGAPNAIAVINFTNSTTPSGIAYETSSNATAYQDPIWLRMYNDGTNVHFSFSYDGSYFHELLSTPVSSGFMSGNGGYVNACVFSNAVSVDTTVTVASWAIT